MPFANDLREQARHLANREPRRPRQASLRRAVSTAYYAVFHLLTTAFVSHWRISRQRAALARAFKHERMKGTCSRILQPNAFRDSTSPHVQRLRGLAKAFNELQQNRHTADYNNSKVWTRTEILSLIGMAEDVFDDWRVIASQEIAQDFLLELLIAPRSD
jgi:uncharacterized protein (UPF0332 family)